MSTDQYSQSINFQQVGGGVGPVQNGIHPQHQHQMDSPYRHAAGQAITTSDGMSNSNSTPPAFLDLADSAARLSSNLPDINSRVEQKRIEHERLRSHHRRLFEEQMRALEEQQLAEERALLGVNGARLNLPINGTTLNPSTNASNTPTGPGVGFNGLLGSGGAGVIASAPATPPSGLSATLSLDPSYPANLAGNLQSATTTPSPVSPGVIGGGNAKRKSVNISSATGIPHTTGPTSSATFSSSAANGARSMPASRRGSSGSGNGADELVAGLATLGIGNTAVDGVINGGDATGMARAGTVPGVVGNGTFGATDTSYLWDEGLEREMQNSLRHFPPSSAVEDSQQPRTFGSLHGGPRSANPTIGPSSDPFGTRTSSVSSVALDLAGAPSHRQAPQAARTYNNLLGGTTLVNNGAVNGSEWPLFKAVGSMTAGNGTPVLAGTPVLGGTHTLSSEGRSSPASAAQRRISTPNGTAPSTNIGLALGFSPSVLGPTAGSPGGLTAPGDGFGGARSVPATPLSSLPPNGLKSAADVVPSPYPEFNNYVTSAQQQRSSLTTVATPTSAYEPISYGSISGDDGYGAPHSYAPPVEYDSASYMPSYLGVMGGLNGRDGSSANGSRPGTSMSSMGRFVSGASTAPGSRIPSGGSIPGDHLGGPKMGGLHGPKHKRSDIDREYNRFNGVHLEELQGEIATMCKDQHGCRYLQKKLEEGVPEHRDMIFRETFPHFAELMTDPFGNYLCQKLLEYSTDEQRNQICHSVAQDLVNISLNMHGTRAVQKMIDFLSTSRQTDQRYDAQIHSIIVALGMHVVTLIKDLNGNHVVQKCLNKLAPEDNQFIYNAVAAHCVEVATHRHGCCVLQRCVDHASDAQRIQLVTEITYNALTLVQDPYGNYVVQYILDLNDNRFSDAVIRQFLGNVCALSVQKFSSNVIEKCIRVAESSTRKMLIEELLNRTRLEKLLRDSFGNYCVQTALDYAEPSQRAVLVEYIRPILPLIRNTPYGKRIQSKLQREQMEAAHIGHYGVQGYHANHAALVNLAFANGTLGAAAVAAAAAQGRPLHGQSLHHASQLVDQYVNQSPLYQHSLPTGLHSQLPLHSIPPQHTVDPYAGLSRNGTGMGNTAYASAPSYSTPLNGFNVNLPLGTGLPEQYPRTNYGYGV